MTSKANNKSKSIDQTNYKKSNHLLKSKRKLRQNSLQYFLFIDTIKNYINNNLKTAKLVDLAFKLNYNVTHLSELIKKATGSNFYELLKKARVEKAAFLLKTTSLSLEAISNTVGYGYVCSFISAFKSVLHITPAEYRKKLLVQQAAN